MRLSLLSVFGTALLPPAPQQAPPSTGWGWGWFWVLLVGVVLLLAFARGYRRRRPPRAMS
jgi:hypothetical protein